MKPNFIYFFIFFLTTSSVCMEKKQAKETQLYIESDNNNHSEKTLSPFVIFQSKFYRASQPLFADRNKIKTQLISQTPGLSKQNLTKLINEEIAQRIVSQYKLIY